MITVSVAQGLAQDTDLARDSLPKGYSYVVDDELSTPIEPILLWLCKTYPPKNRMWRPATVEAAAYDLCDWWRFLVHEQRQWDDVTSDDLGDYRDGLLAAINVRQGKGYELKTIGRRVRAVGAFYEWALKEGYIKGEPVSPRALEPVHIPSDLDSLAHTGATAYRRIDALSPRSSSDPDEHVHPLTTAEWKAVIPFLGPLPSEQGSGLVGLARNRLACEVSLWTGLRVDEVAGLTVHQVLDLSRTVGKSSYAAVEITRTKGLRMRKAMFPRHLIEELVAYIDGEREEGIEVGRRFGMKKAPPELFVNGETARNHAGRAVQAYTLSAAFSAAVAEAGLFRSVERVVPETGEIFVRKIPAHSFHDLRHTFAVFFYQAEVASGNAEPWKVIQSRLGHKRLKTTTDTYLRIVDIFRVKINDLVYKYLRGTLGS